MWFVFLLFFFVHSLSQCIRGFVFTYCLYCLFHDTRLLVSLCYHCQRFWSSFVIRTEHNGLLFWFFFLFFSMNQMHFNRITNIFYYHKITTTTIMYKVACHKFFFVRCYHFSVSNCLKWIRSGASFKWKRKVNIAFYWK